MMSKRVGNVRWVMAFLLGLGIIVNYLDRVNLSITTPDIQKEFHLSNGQIGFVLSAFLWSYAILQIPVGVWLDRTGVKWLVRVGSIIWTIATLLTALVSGFGLLLLARVLLGVGEAPAFPGASKGTGYWFPLRERGLSTSAFDAAAKFSTVIGAPLIAFVVTANGWRAAFYVTAALSLIYGVIFWLFYRDPSESKVLKEDERSYIKEGGGQEENVIPKNPLGSIGFLLKQRKVWGLTLGFAAYNYSFYLFLTWLPGYLQKSLHLSVLTSGWYTVVPWFIATLTDIFIGGVLVDALIRRGNDPTRVRKTVVTIGMLLGLAVVGAGYTTNALVATVWISIALGGLAFAAPVAWSIPALIAPKGTVGSVGSIMNMFGNLAGIAAPIVAGYLLDATHSFTANFLVAAAILVLGILAFLFLLGRIEQIEQPESLVEEQANVGGVKPLRA